MSRIVSSLAKTRTLFDLWKREISKGTDRQTNRQTNTHRKIDSENVYKFGDKNYLKKIFERRRKK